MIRTFSPFYKPETTITLYKSQVLPIVDYACVVWDPHLKKDQHLLESVHTFTEDSLSIMEIQCRRAQQRIPTPTLTSRRSYFKLLMTFKLLNVLPLRSF